MCVWIELLIQRNPTAKTIYIDNPSPNVFNDDVPSGKLRTNPTASKNHNCMQLSSFPSIQRSTLLLGALALGITFESRAVTVVLQQPTATFSQSLGDDFSVARAINGTVADNLGWAVASTVFGPIPSQTAVFETASNIGFGGGSILTFTLTQTHSVNFQHTLGRFRLSVTTDDRSLFADGLASGGDVTANWIVLTPGTISSANGATLGVLGDQSILASGFSPDTDTYTITALTALTGITGVRLEALEHPSLPQSGPGRQSINGNFVLSEFGVDVTAVPEPSSFALISIGCLLLKLRKKN